MAWSASPRSVEFTDDEKLDRIIGAGSMPDTPDYPYGLMLCLTKADLLKAEPEAGKIHDEMKFSAMGEVMSVFEHADDCRIELEVKQFAGADGKFFDLEEPAHICLTRCELDKIDLDEDAERGDTIHLIGTARLENRSSSEYGGDRATLQITHLTFEDESSESRAG